MELHPDWTQAIPEGWEPRLRQISPIAERTSYLQFRYRSAEGVWTLYECTPKALLAADRANQLATHWSELPPSQQHARKRFVSEYQYYMHHTHGVEARLFWVLQGEMGGTPACYSHRERRLLQAVNAPDDVPEIGSLEPCPFDERAVSAIVARDRLFKAGDSLDALLKQNEGSALRSEDDATEKEFRRTFLKWWFVQMIPNSEFMKSYLRTTESSQTLRRATKDEANIVDQWVDHFIEFGTVLGAGHADSRIVIPVSSSIAA